MAADTAPSSLTYAIGDLHGRHDLLMACMNAIAAYAPGTAMKAIFLGDYVDRGPDSNKVIESLIGLSAAPNITILKGNHEDLMVRAFKDRDNVDIENWLMNGAIETLESYGWERWNPMFDGYVPQAHIDFLDGLPTVAEDDLRIFVHAGLIPGVPVDQHDHHDVLWIRQAFLRGKPGDFPKYVVHGHTHTHSQKKTSIPEVLEHRCNLDTGGYHTNVMAIAVFDDKQAAPIDIIDVIVEDKKRYGFEEAA